MIDLNREKFEKLPEIRERLNQGGIYWDGEKYTPKPFMSSFISTAIFLNGAWCAFQEQQKKLDCCREENKAHLEKIDDALNTLCKLQYSSGERIYNDVGNILKGNKDEN